MLTAKEIAQQFGVKDHNVFYVLNTRKIYPDKRVGSTRLYGNEKVEKIGYELRNKRPWTKLQGIVHQENP